MMNKWQTQVLEDICEKITDGTHYTPTYVSKGVHFLSVRNITKGIIDLTATKYISLAEHKVLTKRCRPEKEDILYTKVGTTGIAKVVDVDNEFSIFVSIALLKVKHHIIFNRYLEYFLNSPYARNQAKEKTRGTANKNLVLCDIKKIKIHFPESLFEQRRIVAILDKAFANIAKAKENAEKNLQNAHDVFKSYLQNVFSNPKKNWQTKKLGEVCEIINRGISPKYIDSEGVCVLNQRCIRDHKINFDFSRMHDLKNKKINSDKFIKVGDVLVNSTGTGTLGRVAQVRNLLFDATVDSHITIVRPIKNLFYDVFFGYALIFIEDDIKKRGDGCGGQTELARNTLKNGFTIIYTESHHEQQFIVTKLDALSAQTKKLIDIYQKKIANLDELKKSLLQKAFTGELT